MGKTIHLNFTDTESDSELYNWITSQKDSEEYLKAIISKDMMEERNKQVKAELFTDDDLDEIAQEIELMFPSVKKENYISQITSEDLDNVFNDPGFWD